MTSPTYHSVNVDGLDVFYREAGSPAAPAFLLHGFPTSRHMFRNLIPLLLNHFHLVAPDLPGFGRTAMPPRNKFKYTFDNLAKQHLMQKTFFPRILLVASLVVLSPTLTLGHEGHHAECTDTALNALKADIQAMGEGEAHLGKSGLITRVAHI